MRDGRIKEISVFVDESGSFEPDEESSRYYLICLLLHDQASDISEWIMNLERFLGETPLGADHCVHVGPLIRREGEYADMRREERQMIFRRMMAFVRKADVAYHCFKVDKHFNDGDTAVHDKLLQDLNRFLIGQSDLLNSYNRLKVYYDDGQKQITAILKDAFKMFSSITEFVSDVKPERYRLFQAADLLCSIELVAAKTESGRHMTVSEKRFFGSEREFKREILRACRRKAL